MSSLRVAGGAAVPKRAPAPRAPRPVRPELTVVPDGRSRLGVGLVVGLAVIALFASLLGLAVFHTMLVESQAELDSLDAEIRAAEERTEDLRVEITEAEAPERILDAAERLGMVPAGDVVVLDATEADPAE
jgi:cell division protein FtsL